MVAVLRSVLRLVPAATFSSLFSFYSVVVLLSTGCVSGDNDAMAGTSTHEINRANTKVDFQAIQQDLANVDPATAASLATQHMTTKVGMISFSYRHCAGYSEDQQTMDGSTWDYWEE